MGYTFRPPPGWPTPPADWTPPPGWRPDPSWPVAPEDWQFYEDLPPGTGFDLDLRVPGRDDPPAQPEPVSTLAAKRAPWARYVRKPGDGKTTIALWIGLALGVLGSLAIFIETDPDTRRGGVFWLVIGLACGWALVRRARGRP